ncbi:hypothetical protein FCL40_17245 [Ferrimonas sediminicola]|uniref:Uncharacterized protein n=1 Tax=Ferrimonas sediminicola TaxID=2569538 RepID=A0A4U1B917_9GAMM|nr:hypothetical protein [Ferrimonas sediminicola]TKB46800.1 hypothetical protein FCL40_17245 [Ferrimonas sediminicola]
MTPIEELLKDPEQRAAATKTSRRVMFTFIAIFLVMIYGSGVPSGILGGLLFLAVGLLLVPLTVAVPSFMLQKRHPGLKWAILLLDTLANIAITRALYLGLFG